MDHYSLLEPSSPVAAGRVSKKPTKRRENGSPSAAIAVENSRLPQLPAAPRFPGEDSGRSLAELAKADLDAALHLLADRAQYITGAGGAAIALRRGEHMLCRASVGTNAPELGAMLSMEYGLSGESVRTRQFLRCDDAERDPRVNRELCRELGIASVLVMPIQREQHILGIFELLSGKANAFSEHDVSALMRLSEMVVVAAKQSGVVEEPIAQEAERFIEEKQATAAQVEVCADRPEEKLSSEKSIAEEKPSKEDLPVQPQAAQEARKPLFWSAALQTQANSRASSGAETGAIPAVLQNLKKCQSCGFPVSQGRTFCVECEEKQWRGRPAQAVNGTAEKVVARGEMGTVQSPAPVVDRVSVLAPVAVEKQGVPVGVLAMAAAASGTGSSVALVKPVEISVSSSLPHINETATATVMNNEFSSQENSTTFLSSAVPSESWFAAHKFVLLSLLVVALLAAFVAFR